MSALHAPVRRTPRAPIVGARVAGHRSNREDPYDRIYFGDSSDFGELGDNIWYRLRDTTYSGRPDTWRLSLQLCGRRIHLDAVIDDFGSLVAVP
jgi:hypothetical protein